MSVCADCLQETGHSPTCYYTRHHPICTCTADWVCRLHMPQPSPTTPSIVLVDGETTTPLSAEALVVALFTAVKDLNHAQVIAVAAHFQTELDAGRKITLTNTRVVQPGNGLGPL